MSLELHWRELRAALPARCLAPSAPRSLAYFAWDLSAFAALGYAAAQIGWSAWLAPLWFAQGTLLWALFVIGHDCGHGSFSRSTRLNDVVGHIAHTLALVPYHAWQHSHRIHHRHAGDPDRDEGWFPYRREQLDAMPHWLRFLRFRASPLLFPLYLLRGTPGRDGNHFTPRSPLLRDASRRLLARSYWACAAFLSAMAVAAVLLGVGVVLRAWGAAYVVCCVWIGLVTYLHHTDPAVPWRRGSQWNAFDAALGTVDRSYGPFDAIHHRAGWHTAHHLFPAIPHYHLVEATRAIEPLLSRPARPRALPLIAALRAASQCQVLEEGGELALPYASGAAPRPATR